MKGLSISMMGQGWVLCPKTLTKIMEQNFEDEKIVYPKSYEVHENHVAINLTLSELTPDRVQYKPYNLTYYAHLYVQVILSKSEVVEYCGEFLVLTPKGAALVADQLATAIDEVHNEFRGRSKTF